MTPATVKRAKNERSRLEMAIGRGTCTKVGNIDRPLFQDEFYVIKVINVSDLDQKAQFEALNEIATM